MKLYAREYGQGNRALIIIHGLLGSGDNWHLLAQRFAEAGFHVYTLDLRNHGRSPHSREFNLHLMVEDLLEFMDDQLLTTASVMGHSLGGKVAMQFTLDYPEKVYKLVVADMSPRAFGRGHDDIFQALFNIQLLHLQSRKQAEDQLIADGITEAGTRLFLLKNLSRDAAGNFEWKPNLEILWEQYDEIRVAIQGQPWFGHSLFVRGGLSEYMMEADEMLIQQLFPKSTIETIDHAGHWVHADAPDAYFAICNAFLK
jgi:pimeloyl-ACP methyl ester carboxylesterase